MMNAPTGKVAQKLLSAHRAKSMLLIEDFAALLARGGSSSVGSGGALLHCSSGSAMETPQSHRSAGASSAQEGDMLSPTGENIRNPMLDVYSDISKARQVHQSAPPS